MIGRRYSRPLWMSLAAGLVALDLNYEERETATIEI
jgi:hypothetical protein